jgi:hypothetical protein
MNLKVTSLIGFYTITCASQMYGSQALVPKRQVANIIKVLGSTESALKLATTIAGRLVYKTLETITRHPRSTFALATIFTLAFPRPRQYLSQQVTHLTHIVTSHIEQWTRQRLHQWLFGPYDEKLGEAQHSLENQRTMLDTITGGLSHLRDAMASLSEDEQSLLNGQNLSQAELRQIRQILSGQTDQLRDLTDQSLQKFALLESRLAELSTGQSRLLQDGTTANEKLDKISDALHLLTRPKNIPAIIGSR